MKYAELADFAQDAPGKTVPHMILAAQVLGLDIHVQYEHQHGSGKRMNTRYYSNGRVSGARFDPTQHTLIRRGTNGARSSDLTTHIITLDFDSKRDKPDNPNALSDAQMDATKKYWGRVYCANTRDSTSGSHGLHVDVALDKPIKGKHRDIVDVFVGYWSKEFKKFTGYELTDLIDKAGGVLWDYTHRPAKNSFKVRSEATDPFDSEELTALIEKIEKKKKKSKSKIKGEVNKDGVPEKLADKPATALANDVDVTPADILNQVPGYEWEPVGADRGRRIGTDKESSFQFGQEFPGTNHWMITFYSVAALEELNIPADMVDKGMSVPMLVKYVLCDNDDQKFAQWLADNGYDTQDMTGNEFDVLTGPVAGPDSLVEVHGRMIKRKYCFTKIDRERRRATVDPNLFKGIGGFIETFAQACNSQARCVSPMYSYVWGLAGLGVMLSRKFYIEGIDDKDRGTGLNQFITMLGESTTGKTDAVSYWGYLLESVNPDSTELATNITSHAAVEDHYLYNNRLAWVREEVQDLLPMMMASKEVGGQLGTLIEMIKTYFSQSMGVVYQRTKAKGQEAGVRGKKIHQPSLSIIFTAIEDLFFAKFPQDALTDGMLSRMLIFPEHGEPETNKSRRRLRKKEELLISFLKHLNDIQPELHESMIESERELSEWMEVIRFNAGNEKRAIRENPGDKPEPDYIQPKVKMIPIRYENDFVREYSQQMYDQDFKDARHVPRALRSGYRRMHEQVLKLAGIIAASNKCQMPEDGIATDETAFGFLDEVDQYDGAPDAKGTWDLENIRISEQDLDRAKAIVLAVVHYIHDSVGISVDVRGEMQAEKTVKAIEEWIAEGRHEIHEESGLPLVNVSDVYQVKLKRVFGGRKAGFNEVITDLCDGSTQPYYCAQMSRKFPNPPTKIVVRHPIEEVKS